MLAPPAETPAAAAARVASAAPRTGTPVVASATHPPLPPTAPSHAASPPAGQPRRRGLESTIGAKWTAWIGALAVLLGIAFGIAHYGGDIWGRLSVSARCAMIAAFGGVLVVLGDLARTKIGRPAALGLVGAGLAVLYVDAFGAAVLVSTPILSVEIAFLLMGLVLIAVNLLLPSFHRFDVL